MATTVHIPPEILRTVDAQARRRKVSRNRYIVEALVARVTEEQAQARLPAALFQDMAKWRATPEHVEAVEALRLGVSGSRRSKKLLAL